MYCSIRDPVHLLAEDGTHDLAQEVALIQEVDLPGAAPTPQADHVLIHRAYLPEDDLIVEADYLGGVLTLAADRLGNDLIHEAGREGHVPIPGVSRPEDARIRAADHLGGVPIPKVDPPGDVLIHGADHREYSCRASFSEMITC